MNTNEIAQEQFDALTQDIKAQESCVREIAARAARHIQQDLERNSPRYIEDTLRDAVEKIARCRELINQDKYAQAVLANVLNRA